MVSKRSRHRLHPPFTPSRIHHYARNLFTDWPIRFSLIQPTTHKCAQRILISTLQFTIFSCVQFSGQSTHPGGICDAPLGSHIFSILDSAVFSLYRSTLLQHAKKRLPYPYSFLVLPPWFVSSLLFHISASFVPQDFPPPFSLSSSLLRREFPIVCPREHLTM